MEEHEAFADVMIHSDLTGGYQCNLIFFNHH